MSIKQFIYVDVNGDYIEGYADGNAIERSCDSGLAVGDLVCESSSIANGVDKVTSNSETRDVIGYVIGKPDATTASILTKGVISGLSGLTKAGRVYLSGSGNFTSSIPFNGYIKTLGQAIDADTIDFDPSITKVRIAYKAATPAQYTKILIHSDTSDGDTTFVDSSPDNHSITTVNGPPQHKDTVAKFGNTSMYPNGGGLKFIPISSEFDLTGDFTIDCWFYSTGDQNYGHFFTFGGNGSFTFKIDSADPGKCYVYGNNLSTSIFSNSVTLHTWVHVALERYNGVLYGYLDGVKNLTVSWNATITGESKVYAFTGEANSSEDLHGYIDEYRFLNGYADYKGVDFTPPLQPYEVV
jgi:hypothetical protein